MHNFSVLLQYIFDILYIFNKHYRQMILEVHRFHGSDYDLIS